MLPALQQEVLRCSSAQVRLKQASVKNAQHADSPPGCHNREAAPPPPRRCRRLLLAAASRQRQLRLAWEASAEEGLPGLAAAGPLLQASSAGACRGLQLQGLLQGPSPSQRRHRPHAEEAPYREIAASSPAACRGGLFVLVRGAYLCNNCLSIYERYAPRGTHSGVPTTADDGQSKTQTMLAGVVL